MYNPYELTQMPGMPGMSDMGAPDMKGVWTNRRTGQTVMVRDVVIMDESMSVMFSDGSMMDMNEFSRDYIQMSDEIYDANGNVIGHDNTPLMPPPPHSQKPNFPPNLPPRPELHKPGAIPPHAHPMPPVDDPLHTPVKPQCPHGPHGPHGPHKPSCPLPPFHEWAKPDTPIDDQKHNIMMLHHLFDKIKPVVKPDLSVEVDDKFPKDQLQMLIDIYGVTIEDIAIYIFKHYFTPGAMVAEISEWLNSQGLKDIYTDEPDEDPDDEETTTNLSSCQIDGSFANSSGALY